MYVKGILMMLIASTLKVEASYKSNPSCTKIQILNRIPGEALIQLCLKKMPAEVKYIFFIVSKLIFNEIENDFLEYWKLFVLTDQTCKEVPYCVTVLLQFLYAFSHRLVLYL